MGTAPSVSLCIQVDILWVWLGRGHILPHQVFKSLRPWASRGMWAVLPLPASMWDTLFWFNPTKQNDRAIFNLFSFLVTCWACSPAEPGPKLVDLVDVFFHLGLQILVRR